jgi:hypothetical protein
MSHTVIVSGSGNNTTVHFQMVVPTELFSHELLMYFASHRLSGLPMGVDLRWSNYAISTGQNYLTGQ